MTDDKSSNLYIVTFADGKKSDWLEPDQLRSSGLDETAFLGRAMTACAAEVRTACGQLPAAMRDALAEVRGRVARDELPLLSLLQTEPLQLQSSHLSFQEYFAARALCEGTRLSGAPPWQWPAGWANALALGDEMGEPFAKGLKRAAGVEADFLDLTGKLGGDPPTVMRVVALFSGVLTDLNLRFNHIGPEGGVAISKALAVNAVLTSLDVGGNSLTEEAALGIVRVERQRNKLTSLGLAGCFIGPIGAAEIAEYVSGSGVLTKLDLGGNDIGDEGATALASALEVNGVLKTLLLYNNNIRAEGAAAIAEALRGNRVLKNIDLSYNNLGDEGETVIGDAVSGREGFELEM